MTPQSVNFLLDRLNRAVLGLSVLLLFAATALLIVNVASRFIFHWSLPWSEEVSRYLVVWGTLLAAAVLVNQRQHLAVDLWGDRLAGWSRRALNVVVEAGSLTFFLILAVSGTILVLRTTGQTSPSLEFLPMPVVYAILPISALLMALGSCGNLLRDLGDGDGDAAT